MIRECFRAQTGIQFRRSFLENLGIHVDVGTLDPQLEQPAPTPPAVTTGHVNTQTVTGTADGSPTDPTSSTKEGEERADALSRMHDQLEMMKAWWVLEWLPLRHRRQYHGYARPRHYWSYVSPVDHTLRSVVHSDAPDFAG
jgi:hypothetical protein